MTQTTDKLLKQMDELQKKMDTLWNAHEASKTRVPVSSRDWGRGLGSTPLIGAHDVLSLPLQAPRHGEEFTTHGLLIVIINLMMMTVRGPYDRCKEFVSRSFDYAEKNPFEFNAAAAAAFIGIQACFDSIARLSLRLSKTDTAERVYFKSTTIYQPELAGVRNKLAETKFFHIANAVKHEAGYLGRPFLNDDSQIELGINIEGSKHNAIYVLFQAYASLRHALIICRKAVQVEFPAAGDLRIDKYMP